MKGEAALWAQWWEDGGRRERDALIEHYRPWALDCARRASAKVRGRFAPEEFESAALEGLWRAVEAFRRARGASFRTFARRRVIGACLDHLRRVSPWTRTEYARAVAAGDVAGLARRTRPMSQMGDGQGPAEAWLAVDGRRAPGAALEGAEEFERRIRALAKGDREMMRLYVLERATMAEVGRRLGVSESRVSQRYAAACERLATGEGARVGAKERFWKAIAAEPDDFQRVTVAHLRMRGGGLAVAEVAWRPFEAGSAEATRARGFTCFGRIFWKGAEGAVEVVHVASGTRADVVARLKDAARGLGRWEGLAVREPAPAEQLRRWGNPPATARAHPGGTPGAGSAGKAEGGAVVARAQAAPEDGALAAPLARESEVTMDEKAKVLVKTLEAAGAVDRAHGMSGEALAKALGVAKGTLTYRIETARRAGARIASERRCGYWLEGAAAKGAPGVGAQDLGGRPLGGGNITVEPGRAEPEGGACIGACPKKPAGVGDADGGIRLSLAGEGMRFEKTMSAGAAATLIAGLIEADRGGPDVSGGDTALSIAGCGLSYERMVSKGQAAEIIGRTLEAA